jgi:hypothetical protein
MITGAVAMISIFRRGAAARCATVSLGGITQDAAHDGDDPAAMSGDVTSIERRRLHAARGINRSKQIARPVNRFTSFLAPPWHVRCIAGQEWTIRIEPSRFALTHEAGLIGRDA